MLGNRFALNNKTCLITGGASGLGFEIAKGFAESGAEVILVDLNQESLIQANKEFRERGYRCKHFLADITDWEEVQTILNEFDELDVLVNSAGINIRKTVLDLEPEEFERVINVNLLGTFHCCKAFGQKMLENKRGSIINMASIHSHATMPKQSAYASTKGGVLQLTKVLALEFAPHGVRVNALSPGFHLTPLVKEFTDDQAWYKSIKAKIPMGKFAEAKEIVGPAVFLASDASSYVTGTSLVSDGGFLAQ
jgi:gluconate 5-dehydrogenase